MFDVTELHPLANRVSPTLAGNFAEVKNPALGAGSNANHLTYIGDADSALARRASPEWRYASSTKV